MTEPTPAFLQALRRLDLTSADGRAGLKTALAEIERLSPGAILSEAATIQLTRLGVPRRPPVSVDAPARAPRAR